VSVYLPSDLDNDISLLLFFSLYPKLDCVNAYFFALGYTHERSYKLTWVPIQSKYGIASYLSPECFSFRVHLDVNTEDLDIELDQIPNQTSFANGE
jgi:hypothetical protein